MQRADVLLEGFRPGVMERLGLGPDELLAANPALVYGRMTGWGQTGPLASSAGHDIGYIALTGALGASGRPDERPAPPLNLLGDFGGGGVFLALGRPGRAAARAGHGAGQVVDAAIVDGTAVLTTMIHGMLGDRRLADRRGVNLLDTGAPFYDVYRCADGQFLAVGALEEQFYAALLEGLGLAGDETLPGPRRPAAVAGPARAVHRAFAAAPATSGGRSSPAPTPASPRSGRCWRRPPTSTTASAGVFVEVDGTLQPAVAPRFSATPGSVGRVPRGEHSDEIRAELGL